MMMTMERSLSSSNPECHHHHHSTLPSSHNPSWPLCTAIRKGKSIATIRYLVREQGAHMVFEELYQPNDRYQNYSPLHVAAQCSKNPDVVQYLADTGPIDVLRQVGVDHKRQQQKRDGTSSVMGGRIPLQLAADNRFLPSAVVIHLINLDPNAVPHAFVGQLVGRTRVDQPPRRRLEVIQHLARIRHSSLQERDREEGCLAIHRAALDGNLKQLQLLAKLWPPGLDQKDNQGRLPLHCAALCNSWDVVDFLLAQPGANAALSIPDGHGRRPIHCAVQNSHKLEFNRHLGRIKMLALAWPKGGSHFASMTHVASSPSMPPVRHKFRATCARGLRAFRRGRKSPLPSPSPSPSPSSPSPPLADTETKDEPSDLQVPDQHGRLLLHLAAKHGGPNVLLFILLAWRDALHVADSHRQRLPLHYALENKQLDEMVLELMVDEWNGALQVVDGEGCLPLHVAVRHNRRLAVVEPMVRGWAHGLLAAEQQGWLPVHIAAQDSTDGEVVEFLALACPLSLVRRTDQGCLPLHVAARHAPLCAVRALTRECPRALLRRDGQGRLPVHIALQQRNRRDADVAICLACQSPSSLGKRDSAGWLPLHHAAQRWDVDLVRAVAVLFPQALVEPTTDKGWTPLHVAVSQLTLEHGPGGVAGRLRVVRHLAEANSAALKIPFEDGSLILHRAIRALPWFDDADDADTVVNEVGDDDTAQDEGASWDNTSAAQHVVLEEVELESESEDDDDDDDEDDSEDDDNEDDIDIDDNNNNNNNNNNDNNDDDDEIDNDSAATGGESREFPREVGGVPETWETILHLVDGYLDALDAGYVGSTGLRPVHLAATRNAPLSVLFRMLRTSPDALFVRVELAVHPPLDDYPH